MEGVVGVRELVWISKKIWRIHLFGILEGQQTIKKILAVSSVDILLIQLEVMVLLYYYNHLAH
jgi:hypothetical protein